MKRIRFLRRVAFLRNQASVDFGILLSRVFNSFCGGRINSRVLQLAFLSVSSVLASHTPDWISCAGGVYDLMRPRHQTGEFEIEYKFHLRCLSSPFQVLEFIPLVGVMTSIRRAVYLYGGLNFDFLLFDHLVVAPGFAAGYYWKGQGKDLGYPVEFRSGVEFGWQFSDFRRLGVHFYHLSNASLGRKNPGEESIVFYYDIPIAKGFPFSVGN